MDHGPLTDPMKAVSLWQPWASAVAEGLKPIETRSWRTSYRGWLAIHAARRLPPVVVPGLGLTGPVGGDDPHHAMDLQDGRRLRLPLGAIVAVVRLLDVVPILAVDQDPNPGGSGYVAHVAENNKGALWWWKGENCYAATPRWDVEDITAQRCWGDYTPGRYAWLLEDVHKLAEPIPAKGHQGVWRPDAEIVAKLEAVAA